MLAAKVYGARFGIGEDSFVLVRRHPAGRSFHPDAGAGRLRRPNPAGGARPSSGMKAASRTVHDQMEATDSGVLEPRALRVCCTRATGAGPTRAATRSPRRSWATCRRSVARSSGQRSDRGGDRRRHHHREGHRGRGPHLRRPAAPQASPARARQPEGHRLPDGTPQPVSLTHKGRADQAIGYLAWPTTDYWANRSGRSTPTSWAKSWNCA